MILSSVSIIFNCFLLWIRYFFRGLPDYFTADRLRRWRGFMFFSVPPNSVTPESNEDTRPLVIEEARSSLRSQLLSALELPKSESPNRATTSEVRVYDIESSSNTNGSDIEMQYLVTPEDERQSCASSSTAYNAKSRANSTNSQVMKTRFET